MIKKNVAIIGAGRAGLTLGYLLNRSKRYKVTSAATKTKKSLNKVRRFLGKRVKISTDIFQAALQSEIVFITTPDDKIKETFSKIYRKNGFKDNALVVHCSGNFSSVILKGKRISAGSLHPLQTLANPKESVKTFRGTFCSYESDSLKARKEIVHLIKTIGGVPVKINKSNKPLYHAAGVIASNYLVALAYTAQELLTEVGFSKREAIPALLPLINGTVNNIKRFGPADALTGPIARGDINTVKEHIKAIRLLLPEYLQFYKMLGRYTIKLAKDKGTLGKAKLKTLKKIL